MANSYCQTSFTLKLPTKEAKEDVLNFAYALREPDEYSHPDADPKLDDGIWYDGEIEPNGDSDNSVWFHGDESFSMEYFDAVIFYAMKKYKLPPTFYMWADTCDKMRENHFGGGACVFVYNHKTDEVESDSIGSYEWAHKRIGELVQAIS